MLDIIWKNLLAFPVAIWERFCTFLSVFYNPNEGMLENIFYSDLLWFVLLITIWIQLGGKFFYSIFTVLFSFIIGHMLIVYLGIEVFFTLVGVVLLCIYFNRGTRICLDLLYQVAKYIILIALGGTLLMFFFGSIGVIFGFIVGVIYAIVTLTKRFFLKKRRNSV